MELTLGIDLACRAAHQASLARPDGTFVWTGHKVFTRLAELENLWADLRPREQDTVRVVMESTRNVWTPVASWFRHRGARISMVPTTQSADLRAYYSKHLFNAASQARKTDPQLAAKYKRLMNTGRHHDSALCHIATILLTRIATCWRTGQHYVLRDTDGRTITAEEGRSIVRAHHTVDKQIRIKAANTRQSQRRKGRTGRGQQDSKRSNPPSRQHHDKKQSKTA